jgi:8-oxo-dGTP pyrophosphatase MutT (NUDIX family)
MVAMLPFYSGAHMPEIKVATVDVLLIDPAREHRILVLQRGHGTRCTGAWEMVHGRLDGEERPEDAALREVAEETGLSVSRLYNLGCHAFYLHRQGFVNVAVVFAGVVDSTAPVTLGGEHSTGMWLLPSAAEERFSWPRSRQVVREAMVLLGGGHAGPLEDVLRVF